MLGLDESVVVFLFGALFGVAALLYFVRDVLVSLSVTAKTVVLYGSAVVPFVVGLVVASSTAVLLYLFAGGLSIGATGYVLRTYDPDEVGTFLVLAVSSVAFVALGVGLQAGVLAVSPPVATGVAGSVTVAVIGVVLLDRAESTTVVYDTTFTSTYDGETLGTVTVTNESRFRRSVTLPRTEIEVEVETGPGDEEPRSVPAEYRRADGGAVPDTLAPGAELSLRVVLPERRVKALFERADTPTPERLTVHVETDASSADGSDSPQRHRVALRPAE